MKTIVDYTVVTNIYGDIKALINEVKKKIKAGWQPHGSLCSNGVSSLHQAMIKYELVIQKEIPTEPKKEEPKKEEPKTTPTVISSD